MLALIRTDMLNNTVNENTVLASGINCRLMSQLMSQGNAAPDQKAIIA
jgi:hypothetical protein